MEKTFTVEYDNPNFFLFSADGDSSEPLDVAAMDKLANGYRWSMAVQGTGQRKRHARSPMVLSLWAMLDHVKAEFKNDAYAKVYVLTPDIEILFVG